MPEGRKRRKSRRRPSPAPGSISNAKEVRENQETASSPSQDDAAALSAIAASRAADRHITVNVHLGTFRVNVQTIREKIAPARLCVSLAANAYGHGIGPIVPAAIEAGVDFFGVSTNSDAAAIRRVDRFVRIIRLRMALHQELDESLSCLNVEELVGSSQTAEYLSAKGLCSALLSAVHLNIDTGMGFGGFLPDRIDEIRRVCKLPGLRIAGVMTHFADVGGEDLPFVEGQFARLRETVEAIDDLLPETALIHTHCPAVSASLPGNRETLIRVGTPCYGGRPALFLDNHASLPPVMSIATRIAEVRRVPAGHSIGFGNRFVTQHERVLASLPVGIGEGYPLWLSNSGVVLINGQRCPIVGRISLNMTTVDVTDVVPSVRWGDEAVLIGRQGSEEISLEQISAKIPTVQTELNLLAGALNRITYVD